MANGDVCDRYVELWNLVFMQYYHHLDGARTNLPAPSVDTGMGFERLARILQRVNTAYETDLFTPIIAAVERVSGRKYANPDDTYAIRVVAEHSRSVTFLIADGVVPGNEGRGYVLRRVARRAIRYARRIGIEGKFLAEIADAVIARMGKAYPELVNNREFIKTVLGLEEERFQQAFQNGYNLLTEALDGIGAAADGGGVLAGETAFRLWDTYGFPVEMTQEIARERGVEVDAAGFEREMAAQRERGRASAQFGEERSKIRLYESLGVGSTRFLGYGQLSASSPIIGLIADDAAASEARAGQAVEVILVQTPFYAEGGGQVGDAGILEAPDGRIEVSDTQAVMPDVIAHFGRVAEGVVRLGDSVEAQVDPVRRQDTARNHTATHMLHAALREVLGAHVRQAGSLVAPDRLRFDFSHVQPVTESELWQVQLLVNEKIRANASVRGDEDTYAAAIQRGALAFFGDRYGERVRLIEIANGDVFSFEVCGGTHVGHTGEVGGVYILGETGIGAGMRRLEAVSGRAAERLVWERFGSQESVARLLQTTTPEIEARVGALLSENEDLRRQLEALERRSALQAAELLLDARVDVNGVSLLAARVDAASADSLREISDWLRDKMGGGIVVLGAVLNDRPTISIGITRDLVDKGADARTYARELGRVIGGGGGGRADMAQAGGRDASRLDAALARAQDLARETTG